MQVTIVEGAKRHIEEPAAPDLVNEELGYGGQEGSTILAELEVKEGGEARDHPVSIDVDVNGTMRRSDAQTLEISASFSGSRRSCNNSAGSIWGITPVGSHGNALQWEPSRRTFRPDMFAILPPRTCR